MSHSVRCLCLSTIMLALPAVVSARQGGAPAPAEVAKLIEQLDDVDFDVRAQAEQRLEKFGALTRAALAETMRKHKDGQVRERARAVLRRIHDARVSGLIKALSDRNAKARDAAEKELSADLKADDEMRNSAARASLVRAMGKHPDKGVQASARRILIGSVDVKRVRELIEQMAADDFETRESATLALIKIGWGALEELKRATKHSELEIRRRADRAIKAITGEDK